MYHNYYPILRIATYNECMLPDFLALTLILQRNNIRARRIAVAGMLATIATILCTFFVDLLGEPMQQVICIKLPIVLRVFICGYRQKCLSVVILEALLLWFNILLHALDNGRYIYLNDPLNEGQSFIIQEHCLFRKQYRKL